jgi:hypothetical protein
MHNSSSNEVATFGLAMIANDRQNSPEIKPEYFCCGGYPALCGYYGYFSILTGI